MSETNGQRLLHTMIRVLDLDKSIDFYTRLMGMNLLRRKDYASGRFTLAFVGYGDEANNAVIELTHNWDQAEPYALGTGFGHLAVGVADIYGVCERLKAEGVTIPRPPGPMKHGGSVIAFVEDPDGYKIELIERGGRPSLRTRQRAPLRAPVTVTTGRERKAYFRLLTGTKLRLVAPVNSWRGRPIFCSGSSIISFHWATQPTVRATANSTVNRLVGMPIALKMIPE